MIAFTGVRGDLSKYIQIISSLDGTFHNDTSFPDSITHVMAPHNYVSIRLLGASLSDKWIVHPEWLEACHAAGRWLPEAQYGGFFNSGPKLFRNRTLWMSDAFSAAHAQHQSFQTAALRQLLEKLGRARWCDQPESADTLLVLAEEVNEYKSFGKEILTLDSLIYKIPVK